MMSETVQGTHRLSLSGCCPLTGICCDRDRHLQSLCTDILFTTKGSRCAGFVVHQLSASRYISTAMKAPDKRILLIGAGSITSKD